jgi:murein DD-endopeptidase MepM/ murein hydrolase activator NlpD
MPCPAARTTEIYVKIERLLTILIILAAGLVAFLLIMRFMPQAPIQASEPSQSTATENLSDETAIAPEDVAYAGLSLPELNPEQADQPIGIRRTVELHTSLPPQLRTEIITYTVETGDNLFKIAEAYGLQPETVLWGNYEVLRDNPQFLSPGQELRILPVDGVYYQWEEGDTLDKVADFFKVTPDAIVGYPGNRFDLTQMNEGNLAIEPGTWLVIPGGRRALKDWGPPAITRANPAAAAYYGSGYCGQIYEGAVGTGTFIWPTSATFLSGYDYNPSIHPGIDIAGSVGNAIYATDSGVVVFAGWSEYGYGNLIVLDHGNGWQSAYAHLSAVNVTCGQSVAQGTVIGGLGSTGNSSGPHLHFEMRNDVYGKVNPWDFVSP